MTVFFQLRTAVSADRSQGAIDRSGSVAAPLLRGSLLLAVLMVGCVWLSGRAWSADTGKTGIVHVVVWDERQPEQKQIYENFLGNGIADSLKGKTGFSVTSVCLDDPDQGLPDSVLNACDVLVWWGHKRNVEVTDDLAKRIVARITAGKLSLLCLHSAHWSKPFIAAMNAVTIDRAVNALAKAERATAHLELITSPLIFKAIPKRDDPLTPSVVTTKGADGVTTLKIALPMCVFPAYRADGKPSHMTTLLPKHPIAKDVPASFDISATEMYDEPFHVPAPDLTVFEERWDLGEHFRSGMVWHLGKGAVVYFRPGHEIYPVFKQEIPLRIVENTCRWLFSEQPN